MNTNTVIVKLLLEITNKYPRNKTKKKIDPVVFA